MSLDLSPESFGTPNRLVLGILLIVGVLAAGLSSESFASPPERGVHRFLTIAISPDGKNVASVEGDASPSGGEPVIRTLTIRTTDGKHTTNVVLPCGAVRECWPSSLAWRAEGKSLAFALRQPGSHARAVYTVAPDGSHLTEILKFNGTIIDLRYGRGGKLAMLAVEGATKEVGATQAGAPVTGDLSGPVPEQRIGILEGGKLHWASPADLFVYQYDWLPDGSGFVGTAAHGDGDNNWWMAKLYRFAASDDAARVIFTPPDARHQIADPVVSPDGKTVAFISGIMSDFGSTGGDVYKVSSDGGPAKVVDIGHNMSARSLTLKCGGLWVQALSGQYTEILDIGDTPLLASGVFIAAEALHGDDAGLSWSCATNKVATVHESFIEPPEIRVGQIAMVDLGYAIGDEHDLTRENTGLTMPLSARSIIWKSDKFDVQGWLLLPLNVKGKLPLITIVHGGPASAAVPSFFGPGLNRTLLEHGYALFLPNPRGSFGQGEAFTGANVRDLGHGDLRDILAGIDAAEKVAPIDDKRLGITGGSYGGFMTMWAVTQTNRFKAGVAGAGISNWLSYYGENGIDEWMIPYFGKTVYDDPEIYAHSSPMTYIRNVKTPVFEYVGAQDIECPAPQTQEFWHALHDLGVPTSYAIYPGEGHGLRDPAHIADVQARTLAWFDRYLK